MTTLADNVRQWAVDRHIDDRDKAQGQALKITEEIGEMASLLADSTLNETFTPSQFEEWRRGLTDTIGDIQVTIIISALQNDIDYEQAEINTRGFGLGLVKYNTTNNDEQPPRPELFLTLVVAKLGDYVTALTKGWQDELVLACGELQQAVKALAYETNVGYDEALEVAYNTIKNRKGKTTDSTFIKEEDIHS